MRGTCKPGWALGIPTNFKQMRSDVDRLLEDFFPLAVRGEATVLGTVPAPLALWEEANQIIVEVELPGIAREDIEITLDNNTLRIAAERKSSEEDRKYWHQERIFGKVQRIISLPETVAADTVDAEFRDGVLTLKIAKRPEVQPRKINIRGDGPQAN